MEDLSMSGDQDADNHPANVFIGTAKSTLPPPSQCSKEYTCTYLCSGSKNPSNSQDSILPRKLILMSWICRSLYLSFHIGHIPVVNFRDLEKSGGWAGGWMRQVHQRTTLHIYLTTLSRLHSSVFFLCSIIPVRNPNSHSTDTYPHSRRYQFVARLC